MKCFQFENEDLLNRVIGQSNVVINLVGPRKWVKTQEDTEHININIARRIAKVSALR